ncbi:Uncharacterized protein TCM_022521, partial [Theobroma cacao]
ENISTQIELDKDYFCRGHILSTLSSNLYDTFYTAKIARELWEVLEKKYGNEDESLHNFIIIKYIDFKMTNNKSVVEQAHLFRVLIHELN